MSHCRADITEAAAANRGKGISGCSDHGAGGGSGCCMTAEAGKLRTKTVAMFTCLWERHHRVSSSFFSVKNIIHKFKEKHSHRKKTKKTMRNEKKHTKKNQEKNQKTNTIKIKLK